jgi:hypothetical protein
MSNEIPAPGQGYAPDSVIAKFLNKHAKTLPRWDKNPQLKELGWPPPTYLNGRRHRDWARIQEFLRNAAQATLRTVPTQPKP